MEQYKLPSYNNPDKVFIVNRSELEGNLDSFYYKSSFKILENKLLSKKDIEFKKLKNYLIKLTDGAHLSPESDSIFLNNYVTVKDIDDDGNIDLTNCLKISDEDYNLLIKNGCQPNIEDVLFSKDGTVGRTFHVKNNNFVVLSSLAILTPDKSKVYPKYLEYILRSNLMKNFIVRSMGGSALRRIVLVNLKELKIPVPPLNIQQKIVDLYQEAYNQKQQKEAEAKVLLDSIDSYLLSELSITLPEKDNSLQKRVFTTQFSEVVGRRLDTNFFLEEFKYIEREIEGSTYSAFALKELFHINRGGSPRPINDYFTESKDGLNWIKIGDTKDDDLYIESTKQKIIQEGAKYSRKVEIGDFLLSNSMSFGRPYISNIEGYIHDGWLLFRPKEKINNIFMHTLLGSKLMYKLFGKATIGGVVENLNIDLVKQIRIPLPPFEKQREIAQHIQSIREQAKQLQNDAKAILEQAKQQVELMILG